MDKPEEKLKSKVYILLCAGMILPAAFLYSARADVPHVFIFAFLGLIISLLTSKPFQYSDRSVIYSILTALVLAFLMDYVFKVNQDRLGTFSDLLITPISAPTFLYLAVLITFYESSPHVLGICGCLSLTVLMQAGEMVYRPIPNERLPFLTPWMQNLDVFYGVIILIEMFFLLLALKIARKTPSRPRTEERRWGRLLVRLMALALIPLLTVIGLRLLEANKSLLRKLELEMYRLGHSRWRRGRQVIFSKDIDLNRTNNDEMAEDQAQILLRVQSRVPPGYLRGRTYNFYFGGNWSSRNDSFSPLPFTKHEGILAYNTFYYSDSNPAAQQLNIFPAGYFRSKVLLLPGNTKQIDIVADRLNHNQHGTVNTVDWEKDGGYTVYVDNISQESSFPKPTDAPNDPRLLKVYSTIKNEISNELKGILRHHLVKDTDSDRTVVMTLVSHFLNNYEYQLNTRNKPGMDPVVYFLREKQKGHCELFASAMVLLLRERGIPARYVTGFICTERHPSGSYYVARLGHAHAWAEAYLRDEKKWMLVEATPPTGVPNFSHEWGPVESWYDRLKQAFQQIIADTRRGFFAKAIIAFFGSIFGLLRDLLWHPLRGPLIIGPLLIWLIYYQIRHRRIKKQQQTIDGQVVALQQEFRNLERSVVKKPELKRENNETIEEWVKRLFLLDSDRYSGLQEVLQKYQALRFRIQPPSPEEIAEIRSFFRKYLSQLKV